MCIAIVKPAGSVITEERLRACFENNPDGAGIYTPEGGVIKGLMTADDFVLAYEAYVDADTPALLHCRITTRGSQDEGNTHPFALQRGALIHNGTFRDLGQHGTGPSDSAILASMLYSLTSDQIKGLVPILEDYTSGSRVALMFDTGEFLLLNKESWHQQDGVWYSNRGYDLRTTLPQWDTGRKFYTGPYDYWKKRESELQQDLKATTAASNELYGMLSDYDDEDEESKERGIITPPHTLDIEPDEAGFLPIFEWDNDVLYVQDERSGILSHDPHLQDKVMGAWEQATGHIYPFPEDETAEDADLRDELTNYFIGVYET